MSDKKNRHNIRRLAMQVLYQIDLTGSAEKSDILEGLDSEINSDEVRQQGVDLALLVWDSRDQLDNVITSYAEGWPTHRQPAVDRAILRLACFEITSGRVAAAIAIDEAIEIAKQYASADSPSFINGVLDKVAADFLAKVQIGNGEK